MSARTIRLVGLYAIVAGVLAVIVAPLLGLAYFGIADGAKELETSTVAWWADPARDVAGRLLTFASANRVYSTYVQIVALLFPAVVICAFIARSRRTPRTRAERWGWRLALTGYALMQTGVAIVSIYLIAGDPNGPVIDIPFLALMIPGLLLGTIGSTVLGVSLLRGDFQPRGTVWLLAIAFPGWFLGSDLLGHNSIGMLPMFLAWGVFGARLAAESRQAAPVPGQATVGA